LHDTGGRAVKLQIAIGTLVITGLSFTPALSLTVSCLIFVAKYTF
jgi:hypothetical protein